MVHLLRKIFGTPGNTIKDFNATLQEKSLKKQIYDEKKEITAEETSEKSVLKHGAATQGEVIIDNRPMAAPYTINEMFKKDHPFERRDTTKRRQLTPEEVEKLQNARKGIKEEQKE